MRAPLGWKQLRHRPARLAVALAGIGFAVLLIMMQLGFRSALFESAVRFHERLEYDIALFSVDSVFIVRPQTFSIRRLHQARAHEKVLAATPVYIFQAIFKNPWNHDRRNVLAIGFDPDRELLRTEGFAAVRPLLSRQDAIAFDAGSRPEFGPVAEAVRRDGSLVTEVNDREVRVVGVYTMGTSFGIDGSIVTSEDNWLRLFPERPRDQIALGLLRLAPDADPVAVRGELEAYLPDDVLVMTRGEFVAREKAYWNGATPIGYIFAFGAIMGFVVGAIIVYQILFADVTEHLAEYATLRAMGYPNRFVAGIVLQQAAMLGALGFLPGLAAVTWLYGRAAAATNLPLHVTPERALGVFAMTLGMCAISALLAIRKLRRIDPAEVF
ncbi:MAG: ABC transporter permease DevC [Thermoanaerobaculia bacterium]|nr:ABC transporter permease DevC [Thermoanaerobaculia bacterium]